jgi:uncharacterized membrane protein (DUF485 family)
MLRQKSLASRQIYTFWNVCPRIFLFYFFADLFLLAIAQNTLLATTTHACFVTMLDSIAIFAIVVVFVFTVVLGAISHLQRFKQTFKVLQPHMSMIPHLKYQ